MDASFDADPSLEADLAWLRRFAGRLARDPGLIDDACQDAWLSASRTAKAKGLQGPPSRSSLVSSLRNSLFRRRRSAARRRWHEARGAQTVALPSTAELLVQGESCATLWQHVRALEEPVRSTVMLHYGEGVTVQELASRLDLAEDSVRWRLRKGRTLLRESLERDGEHQALALVAMGAGATRPLLFSVSFLMLKYAGVAAALALAVFLASPLIRPAEEALPPNQWWSTRGRLPTRYSPAQDYPQPPLGHQPA